MNNQRKYDSNDIFMIFMLVFFILGMVLVVGRTLFDRPSQPEDKYATVSTGLYGEQDVDIDYEQMEKDNAEKERLYEQQLEEDLVDPYDEYQSEMGDLAVEYTDMIEDLGSRVDSGEITEDEFKELYDEYVIYLEEKRKEVCEKYNVEYKPSKY